MDTYIHVEHALRGNFQVSFNNFVAMKIAGLKITKNTKMKVKWMRVNNLWKGRKRCKLRCCVNISQRNYLSSQYKDAVLMCSWFLADRKYIFIQKHRYFFPYTRRTNRRTHRCTHRRTPGVHPAYTQAYTQAYIRPDALLVCGAYIRDLQGFTGIFLVVYPPTWTKRLWSSSLISSY